MSSIEGALAAIAVYNQITAKRELIRSTLAQLTGVAGK